MEYNIPDSFKPIGETGAMLLTMRHISNLVDRTATRGVTGPIWNPQWTQRPSIGCFGALVGADTTARGSHHGKYPRHPATAKMQGKRKQKTWTPTMGLSHVTS